MYSLISALFDLIINMILREDIAKFERLEKHEKPTFEVVSSVFRALSRKKIPSAGSFQRQVLVASFKDYPRLMDYASQPKWASRPEGKLESRSRRSLHARQIHLLRLKTTGADRNLQHPLSCVFPCWRRHRHGTHVRHADHNETRARIHVHVDQTRKYTN